MAILSDVERQDLTDRIMRDLSAARIVITGATKADLRAAVNATDVWTESVTASYVAALPLPARTVLTAQQKYWLLEYVLQRRRELS